MMNKKSARRLSTAALTAVLTAAMAFQVFAADVPAGSINMRTDASAQETGERPEPPQGENGERPEPPQGENGERPGPPGGRAGERPEKMTENGELPDEMEGKRPKLLNPDAVEKAISEITESDADTASALTELLETYKSALDAEKEALDSGEVSEDELTSLREAVKDAAEALNTALEEASIEIEDNFRPTGGRELKGDASGRTERPEFGGCKSGKENTSTTGSSRTEDEAQTSDTQEESGLKGIVKNIEGSIKKGFKNFGSLFKASR